MKLIDLSRHSLKAIGRSIGLDVQMVDGHLHCTPLDPDDPRYATDFIVPSWKMVDACRADDFDFFQPFIDTGKLTVEQMHHAAQRYHLGKTRSGRPMFWMIDDMLTPLDAHITSDTWLSQLLKKREPLLEFWCPTHCLFGLHLLSDTGITENPDNGLHNSWSGNKPVCVVESEQSAVVLSELIPESIWMACNSVPLPDISLFAPLQGHKVTIYPHTDSSLSNYLFFDELAASAVRHYHLQLTASSFLEDNATEEQKERNIDLVDFLFEHTEK